MEKFEIVSQDQVKTLRTPRKKAPIAQEYEKRLQSFINTSSGNAIKISLNGTGAGTVKARLRRAALTLGIDGYKIKQKGSVIIFWLEKQDELPDM